MDGEGTREAMGRGGMTSLLMECLQPFQPIHTVNEETVVLANQIFSSAALLSQATLKVLLDRQKGHQGSGLTASPLERSLLLQVPWTQLKKRSEGNRYRDQFGPLEDDTPNLLGNFFRRAGAMEFDRQFA
jgi:hypothetical protein